MSLFGWFEEKLNEESEKREAIKLVVKELEAALRVLETHLQLIHQSREAETAPLVARARELFAPVKSALTKLAATVPVASFYRFVKGIRLAQLILKVLRTVEELHSAGGVSCVLDPLPGDWKVDLGRDIRRVLFRSPPTCPLMSDDV